MLRSFDVLRDGASADAVIVSGDESLVLKGGGEAYAMPWHWHDCVMLLLPATGAVDLRHEDRPEGSWVSEDRFALVPAGRAHATRSMRDTHAHVALYLTEDAMRRVETGVGSLGRVRQESRATALFAMTPRIRALLDLCRRTEEGGGAVLGHLSSALLIDCLAEIDRARTLPDASRQSHGAGLVREVQAHLAARLGAQVALDEVAERFGISRRHLTRSFHQHTGLTIGEFQLAQRLAVARRLLVETDLPIGEIAYRVGFESGSALSRALRRQDGLSPSQIRAMARSVTR